MQRISTQSLTKSYGTTAGQIDALGPINLEILPGEFVCILGESGCGKSTLWRILAGLELPTGGQVTIDGIPVTGPDHKRGVVFQNHGLLPWLSVKQNLALGFKIRGEQVPHKLIEEAIELVGIKGFENIKPGNLSGGMAQRVAIARALVNKPDILLMDEPFGALDAITRIRLQNELIRLWEGTDITVIFITHDIDEALALATRIVVMTPRPGKIARTIQVSLEQPRSRKSPDFFRLKGMISDELVNIVEQQTII